MRKIHRIHLTSEERAGLEAYCKKGKSASKAIKARSLLLADESPDGPALKDPAIIKATGIASATLGRLRKRACLAGPLQAIHKIVSRHPRRTVKMTGEVEARLAALACSQAPDGRRRWTLKLLADKLVELEIVESIGPETVRRALKKTRSSLG